MPRQIPFPLGVSVAIDRIALSAEGGPIWSALSRRNLTGLAIGAQKGSQVASVALSALKSIFFPWFVQDADVDHEYHAW